MADTKKTLALEAKLKDLVSKEMRKMGKEGKTAGQSIAAGFIKAQLALGALKLAIRGTVRFVKAMTIEVARQGDIFAKTSKKIGVGIETLSAYEHAAELSGLSFQTLANGLKLLNKNALDASKGVGESVDVFNDLGIEIRKQDGSLKSANDLFLEIADSLRGMKSELQRSAFAQRIFGRSGSELVPMLMEGREGIKAMTDEAERFGIVFTEAEGRIAEGFNDSMRRLKSAIEGIKKSISIELLPVLTEWMERMAEFLADNREEIKAFAVSVLTSIGQFAISATRELIFVLGEIKDIVAALRDFLDDPTGVKKMIFGKMTGRELIPSDFIRDDAKSTGELWAEAFDAAVEGFLKKVDTIGKLLPTGRTPLLTVRDDRQKPPEEEDFTGFIGGVREAIVVTKEWSQATLALGRSFATSFAGEFTNAVFAIQDGTKKVGESFREMAVNILKAMQSVIISHITAQFLDIVLKIGASLTGSAAPTTPITPSVSFSNLTPLPALAEGGIVRRPTLAMIGEAGPEAVIPLNKAGGAVTINQTIIGTPGMDETALANRAADEIQRRLRSSNRERAMFRNVARGGLV